MRRAEIGSLSCLILILAACSGTVTEKQFDVEEASILELQGAMEQGELTSERLVRIYLERIDRIDGAGNPDFSAGRRDDGPALNSIIEVNPDALSIAIERDRERSSGRVRGPLHGIPVVIKDNIDTADRMMTTAGSLALEGHRASRDAFIVEKLRDAGAVIIAKANLSEWANFRSTSSSSGWSSRGGQTRNPYVLDRNPCGSSSGSAVAVSANLATAGIGTETDGSIVCPSSSNGIVGLKPTVGLWSRSGIIPISASQDTAGPMTRTVEDAAILLGLLAGADHRDEATSASAGNTRSDYTQFLDIDALGGKRIGIFTSYLDEDAFVYPIIRDAIETLRSAGAEVVDDIEFENPEGLGAAEWTVLLYEFRDGIEKYLETVDGGRGLRTIDDLVAFNDQNADRVMPWFGQEIFELAAEKGGLEEKEYLEAREKSRRLAREEGLDAILREHDLDALVAPTLGPAWPTDLIYGDRYPGGYSRLSAVSGYPHITVPAGFVRGLPVGVSFFGPAWSEPELLALAYAFEQRTGARRAPQFQYEVSSSPN